MSKEKRRVPKLRFPGFTEDWEQCKLKSIANTIVAGGDIDKNKIKESGTYPVIANALTKDGVVGYYEDTYRIEAPAVTVTGRGDIGVAKARHQNFTPVVRLLSLTTAHDVDFIENAINNLKIVSESTGVAQLTVPQLSNYKIHITSILEERKIGLFISKVDNLITLHQRKLNNLKLKKKALLQKLFPKNGKRYPELRFPGFTDAWEQRKLDNIAKIKTGGGTPKTTNLEYWSGDIPWIQSSDLVEGDVVHVNIKKFIDNNALKNSAAKLISRDSIALVTRVGVGKVAVINQDFTTSQDFLSLSDFDGNDIKFIAYQLFRLMQENAKVLQGTSIKGISKTDLIEQSIAIPNSIKEQNLIASLLSQTDSIITLHQRKLDHLQLQKKALLQQMFV